MSERDYTTAPISEQLGLPNIVAGLVTDLEELRAGKISVNDAMARSMLAKQIFNGVRIYLNGTKLLAEAARPLSAARGSAEGVAPVIDGESSRERRDPSNEVSNNPLQAQP